jgi:hypothetical protein
MILLDKTIQVDLHVQWLPRCQNVKCDKNQSEWTVVNNHHLFVKRKVIQLDAKQQFKPPQMLRSENYWENVEPMNTHQNYAIQYLADQAVRHESEISRLIQSVQCEQRRIKHAQAVSIVQYKGWLAASQLGLRKCVKLAATGNTVSAIECAPINVTFTIQRSHHAVLSLATKILHLVTLDGSWQLINIVTGPALTSRLTSMTVHTHIEILLGS